MNINYEFIKPSHIPEYPKFKDENENILDVPYIFINKYHAWVILNNSVYDNFQLVAEDMIAEKESLQNGITYEHDIYETIENYRVQNYSLSLEEETKELISDANINENDPYNGLEIDPYNGLQKIPDNHLDTNLTNIINLLNNCIGGKNNTEKIVDILNIVKVIEKYVIV